MKVLLATIFILSHLHGSAQKVHGFLFCKTNDPKIHQSVKLNYATMKDLCMSVANALDYQYVDHSLTGPNFTTTRLNQAVETSSIGEDDIVFLYFSTHGAKSIWDTNDFPQVDVPSGTVSSYAIHNQVAGKNPRAIITLVEACSGYKDLKKQEAFLYEQTYDGEQNNISPIMIKNNLMSLFSGTCNIIVCAGQPGMDTWATDRGSIFTNSFVKAFNQAITAQDLTKATWNSILNTSKNLTYAKTKRTTLKHFPVWELKDCDYMVRQTIVENSAPINNAKLIIASEKLPKKLFRGQRYKVDLKIESIEPIDSVTYLLHHTMPTPKVTITTQIPDYHYEIPPVWGEYEVKAKVYFSDGEFEEIIGMIDFNGKRIY